MLRIKFEVRGIPKAKFKKLQHVLSTFEPELKIVGRHLLRYFKDDVFETEGAIFNSSWKELTPKYAAWKAKKYPGRGILEASGEMRRGYQLQTSAKFARIINKKKYAVYHHEGRGHLPERVMVKVDSNKQRVIADLFKKEIQKRIRSAING